MLLIRHASIVNEGKTFAGAILVDGELIADIFKDNNVPESLLNGVRVIDAAGCLLLPGAIDTHVHFRDPGLTHKGDVATESAAAIAGGVTSFLEMPNTSPATVTLEAWEAKMVHAAECSYANYAFYIGATNSNLQVLKDADYTKVPGVKLFMGSSTGNMLVSQASALEEVFRFSGENGIIVAAHCESEALIRAHREAFLRQYGVDGDLPLSFHQRIRDNEVCYSSSSLAVSLAKRFSARLHLMHVSSKEELSLLDDKQLSGKMITAETCPHYLWLAQQGESFEWRDGAIALHPRLGQAAFKCNPAIKTGADREALRQAAASHLIDTFGTDHAPHLPADKVGGAMKAASGMPSVQFFLPLLLECLPAETVVEKAAHNPARLFRVEKRGFIRKGYYADFVLVRPSRQWTITRKDVLSRCGWSPYEGQTLSHRIEQTYLNGKKVYDYSHNPREVLPTYQKSLTFAPPI